MKNKKFIKSIFMLITVLFIPTLFSWLFEQLMESSVDKTYRWLLIPIFLAGCVALILLWELGEFIWKVIKGKPCLTMLQGIDKVANSIRLENGEAMFDILEQDYCLYESVNSNETPMKRRLRDSHHIVYHSTTAKKHLNWIEFVFWSFLGRLHKELGCEVIVSLHYDEKARESGLQTLKEQERYQELFESYAKIAKDLIGKDITVLDEEHFHTKKKYATFYAFTFHNKFVKSIIQYVTQAFNGEIDYKGFMRKISYIESVFPIMVLSKSKIKHSRLYVLDRELAHEVWQQSPFLEFKNRYGIYFITAKTITDAEGNAIRIFSPDDTVNITDNRAEISRKLKNMDEATKKTMFHLLSNSLDSISVKYGQYPEVETDNTIADMILDIQRTYGF